MSEFKVIQSAQEVEVSSGQRAMLVVFEDGDWTWWYVEGNEAAQAVRDLVGETVEVVGSETLH